VGVTTAAFLAALALLIPPPPAWEAAHFSGPGLLCGTSYGIDLLEGESATTEWPGEFLLTEIFGYDNLATAGGEIVIREFGARAEDRPRGPSRAAGRIDGRPARYYGDGLFGVVLERGQTVRTVTFEIPETFHEADRRALFARVHLTRPEGIPCLRRDNPGGP
jgi:hypothetical protein